MTPIGKPTSILSLVVVFILAVPAQAEMDKVVMETQLDHGFYPGSLFTAKLYLHPEARWFRINLQDSPGDINSSTADIIVALTMRVTLDPDDDAGNTVERNWLDSATAGPRLDPAEKHILGDFPFYADSVFEISILCNMDQYEVKINSFDKFTFQHQETGVAIHSFDVMRIMANNGTVDVCWTKYDGDYVNQSEPAANDRCSIPIQHGLCDELVCLVFADSASMYTADLVAPTTTSAAVPHPGNLEEMAEQVCCIEEMIKDIDSRPFQESLQAIIDVTSELFSQNASESWASFTQVSSNGPLRLLKNVDIMAQAIGDISTPPLTLTANTSSLKCKISVESISNLVKDGWSFIPSDMSNDFIGIAGDDFDELGLNGSVVTVLAVSLSDQVDLINLNQDRLEDQIASDVISISVFGPDGLLSVPVSYTRQITTLPETSDPLSPVCAFWDFNIEGSVSGSWSEKGCSHVVSTGPNTGVSTGEYVSCHCNHTTNYAILMRLSPIEDDGSSQVLRALTMVGCIISILALLMALGFFIFVKHTSLDTERILIHRHLMGALLAAMIMFLIGTFLVDFRIPCQVLAFLQHYLFLAVFSWMLVEGVHLYRLIVTVYGSEKQMAKIYYSVGWGVPLLVVIISAAAKWSEYGVPGKGCWLNAAHGFIWAFVAPACLIMLVNLVVLGLVVKTTVLASKLNSQDKLSTAKTGLRSSLVLLPMLGITWAIGMVPNTVCSFIFVILNSTQGLWLVIVCCVMNGEVRNAFKQTINKKMGQHSAAVDASSATAVSTVSRTTGEDKITDVD